MFAAVLIAWTAVVAPSLSWNVRGAFAGARALAETEARASFEKDLAFRRWAAVHGGVYVPVAAHTPPNPWLQVPNRDVVTTGGLALTLMNPAYMTRQLHEVEAEREGVTAHVTSLRPLRPGNAPDAWEAVALRRIEGGAASVVEEVPAPAGPELRYMGRLTTEARCLLCHRAQGYREGDVRGGIAITVPLAPFHAVARGQVRALALGQARAG